MNKNKFFVALLQDSNKDIKLMMGEDLARLYPYAQEKGLVVLQVIPNITKERAAKEMVIIQKMLTKDNAFEVSALYTTTPNTH